MLHKSSLKLKLEVPINRLTIIVLSRLFRRKIFIIMLFRRLLWKKLYRSIYFGFVKNVYSSFQVTCIHTILHRIHIFVFARNGLCMRACIWQLYCKLLYITSVWRMVLPETIWVKIKVNIAVLLFSCNHAWGCLGWKSKRKNRTKVSTDILS